MQASLNVVDTADRTMAAAVVMCRASWLQSSDIPKDLETKIEDLPFDKEKFFSTKTDEVLHSMKDSRLTLRTLGIFTPALRCKRYQPYQQGEPYSSTKIF